MLPKSTEAFVSLVLVQIFQHSEVHFHGDCQPTPASEVSALELAEGITATEMEDCRDPFLIFTVVLEVMEVVIQLM